MVGRRWALRRWGRTCRRRPVRFGLALPPGPPRRWGSEVAAESLAQAVGLRTEARLPPRVHRSRRRDADLRGAVRAPAGGAVRVRPTAVRERAVRPAAVRERAVRPAAPGRAGGPAAVRERAARPAAVQERAARAAAIQERAARPVAVPGEAARSAAAELRFPPGSWKGRLGGARPPREEPRRRRRYQRGRALRAVPERTLPDRRDGGRQVASLSSSPRCPVNA
jgi:hypothetical protein